MYLTGSSLPLQSYRNMYYHQSRNDASPALEPALTFERFYLCTKVLQGRQTSPYLQCSSAYQS
jgi:hypothetical protein